LQGAALGNQAQAQAYNQALGGYNLPLAQLGAFRQATAPTYINPYQQAAVAGPDILGAYSIMDLQTKDFDKNNVYCWAKHSTVCRISRWKCCILFWK
jgi:hypothetical protein